MKRLQDIVKVVCYGLHLLIILSNIVTCAGYEIFLPLSSVKVTIPQTEKSAKTLTKAPLGKFQVLSLKPDTNSTSSFIYTLENDKNYLQINGRTGEVFVGSEFKNLNKPATVIVTATNSLSKGMTHMSIEVIPSKEKDFCLNFEKLCFWDSAMYSTIESDIRHDPIRIGELGPYSFKHLCPQFDISYKLKNSSDYLSINDSVLYTNGPFDHDSFKPGPNLVAVVECYIRKSPSSEPHVVEKTLHISVLDRNDNGPKLQEKEQERMVFQLDDPHFVQNQLLGKKIIFLDKDSLTVNNHITYEIINDTFGMLMPECNAYETDHLMGLKSSVISCQLKFLRNGILRRSPYCVFLAARDSTVDSADGNYALANICLEADLDKIHEIDRPTAMALQSAAPLSSKRARNGRDQKNSRRLVQSSEDSLASSELGSKSLKPVPIVYPKDIFIYRTATNLSRVTQSERMRDLLARPNVKFNITHDPTGAFGITKLGGILYVKNVTALKKAPETTYYITVSWVTETVDIIVHLENGRPPNTTCEELDEKGPSVSCSEVGTKNDCNRLCAHGTDGNACQWRTANKPGLTITYSTCSPNLTFCPDNICDPLEEMAQKVDRFVCPQDCSPSDKLFGPLVPNDSKRGISAASGICTCDHFGKCSCAVHDTFPAKLKKSNRSKNNAEKKSNQTVITAAVTETPGPFLSTGTASFECGPSCLILMIGCPTVLVVIVVGLIISRRKYVRRAKRKTLPPEKCTGDSRNADLPLVSIENEFKFDINCDGRWEFPRAQLVLDISLGEGEFGKVVKGYATNIGDVSGVTTVAVKMLKTGANSVEHLALLSEFQLLQEVSHPNVIKLLGACTKGETPLIIIEYAMYGSLRSYLRLSRKIECSGIEFTNGVEAVTAKDILSFAWQICKGMAYLTEIKLVHRDLAARNVLLAEGKICKVSDFGLTRDVYEDDAYLKRSKDRVPVKWMAPESLADHVYTTKSDVWAFGVLAWELITLGASPYPGVPPQNLYHLLKTGYRMERPDNCSEEIYSIVRQCWTDDPGSRPSFKYLASQWEKLLGNNAQYLELEANAVSNPLYCHDRKESQPDISKLTNSLGEPDSVDHFWRPPSTTHEPPDQSNSRDQCSFDQTSPKIPPGYDMPRPLIEAKTTEQNLRYENDLRFPLNITVSRDSELLDPNHYSVPKRGKSYIDMTNKTLITDNLDNEDIEKKLSKNISFRFSSLLNLNEQTSVV